MNFLKATILTVLGLMITACSKAPEATAKADPGPDNAVTRYAENLAGAESKAQASVDKMNASTAQHQQNVSQGAEPQ